MIAFALNRCYACNDIIFALSCDKFALHEKVILFEINFVQFVCNLLLCECQLHFRPPFFCFVFFSL